MGMRKHQESGGGVNLGLIITPMLDMSFQILSFFIMTYHPSALEGHIPGSLAPPADIAKKGEVNKADDILPPSVDDKDILAEVQDAITVIIKNTFRDSSDDKGKPGKVYIQRKTTPAPDEVANVDQDGWKNARLLLKAELKRLHDEGTVEKGNIKIAADYEILQQYIMEAYDICKQSGYPKIHFVPPPLTRKAE